ncbi:hypothetical protein [Bacteroides sp. 14(A)]|uniref:hypothetical protein n=1 Tax=Bacteroides sp. 14(A) TaxID=1163670 RepID=UPI00047862E8|nr:hypothetical protein [Bacteroides sp. 14(A)]
MNNQQRVPGLGCPRCRMFIPTSVVDLITAKSLKCPTCGLELVIDKAASSKALEALRKVEDAQRRVEESSTFNR